MTSSEGSEQQHGSYRNCESSVRLEERSEDSDSAGSLKDFIVSSDSDEDVVGDTDDEATTASTALAQELISSVPFDAAAGGTVVTSDGLRRSTRRRKPVERYVDDNFLKMMLDDVSDLEDGEDEQEEEQHIECASDDEDYVLDSSKIEMSEDTESESESDSESSSDDRAKRRKLKRKRKRRRLVESDDEGEAADDEAEDGEDDKAGGSSAPLADWAS